MRWTASILAFFLVGTALAVMLGCAAKRGESFVTLHTTDGNPVSFDASVDPAHYDEVLARVQAVVRGRLPGVRFELRRYPIVLGNGRICYSFRAPALGLIAFSWWIDETGGWAVRDLEWEVDHLVAGTDDQGRPWRGM